MSAEMMVVLMERQKDSSRVEKTALRRVQSMVDLMDLKLVDLSVDSTVI